MAMAIAHLIIMIPFLIFAIILSRGKGGFLLAGYNNFPESEKEQYDEVALCKVMGKMMYGICLSFLLFALSSLFEMKILFNVGLILLIAIVIFGTWYVYTDDRFKK
ncbi:DUF3784 domain-containing protein [Caldifermentibacillus hisashii]|uniref:DUF3784 domain-containing protein n=1 Tax=Caldifermentibacillus hisashii TaxID=996558 RepID=UPI002DFC0884|nr:DUF3784 domain-containing protein [Caldifermentibacillus hisashii]